MEISLKPEHEQMLDEEISRGAFSSRDEAIAEALDLLARQREATVEDLRRAVQEGFDAIDRGDYAELRTPEDYRAFAAEVARRSKARNAAAPVE